MKPSKSSRLSVHLIDLPAPEGVRLIHCLGPKTYDATISSLSAAARAYLGAMRFSHGAGKSIIVPGADGEIECVILCTGEGASQDRLLAGKLPALLPPGDYAFSEGIEDAPMAALAFLLGAYRFTRYKSAGEEDGPLVRLHCPGGIDAEITLALAEAISTARDLINTPASDLGPEAFASAALAIAEAGGATARLIVGAKLLDENFPMIHAVGRAAAEEPRLIDFTWGDPTRPKVTLVGKSVCFDTGGLNLKPDASMLLMKKDMGGGAITLGLAQLIMRLKLPVRLRVLLPIVENSVSAASFRPGDVLRSRAGLSVEIGNTDAEGRLILADALALADEETPDLLLDFATLTGAARVALGPDLPPFFTDDESLASEIGHAAIEAADPAWRLPLWPPYDQMLASKIADLNHIGGPFAGAIVAALFLKRFVRRTRSWCHFDAYCWNPSTKPARPEGGEGQLIRLVHALLLARYGQGRTAFDP